MTSPTDRPGTALLVIDAQNGVLAGAHQRDAVVANIAALIARPGPSRCPSCGCSTPTTVSRSTATPGRSCPNSPRPGDGVVVRKEYGDAFEATELERVLAEGGIGHLVISGAQTDACVRATLHGGFVRGYDVTLVSDAHTTEDLTEWGAPPPAQVIAHANLYWTFQTAPGP